MGARLLAIVTLIGFAIVPWGLVSALAGLFGVIAGSIVCCCGPKAKGEGDGQDDGGRGPRIIAAVFHFIGDHPAHHRLRSSSPPRRPPPTTTCDSTDQPGTSLSFVRPPLAAPADRTLTDSCPGTADDPYGIEHLANCTSADGLDVVRLLPRAALIAIFAWPVMIFALVAMILEIVGAVKCMKAKKAILAEGGPSVK